jgi:acetate---CoA ligase (ADP-forming)
MTRIAHEADNRVRGRVEALFSPRSIALVGASTERHKWGNYIARHLLLGEAKRKIFLVNPRSGDIDGVATYPSLDALPETPDCLVVVVPPEPAEVSVMEALRMGVKGFCIMTGGFGEVSAEGRAAERRIAGAIREKGGVLIGPNCVGYQDSAERIYATRILYPEGPIGVVSQSGLITHDLSRYAIAQKTGFSRALNLGNQADLDLAEAVGSFVGHESTRALIVYCEDLGDGRAFLQAAAEMRMRGVPVVLLTVGASEAAARSALSHTGALVTPMDAMDAACRAAGIIRAETAREAVALADALSRFATTSRGRRVGIVTDGGGLGSLSSELVSLAGLEVPPLSATLQTELKSASGPRAGTSNPVDMAGEADYDVAAYGRVISRLLGSDEVDIVLLSAYFGGYSGQDDAIGRAETTAAGTMVEAVASTGKPLVVHSLYPDFGTGDALRAGGVPVYRDLESAVAVAKGLAGSDITPSLPELSALKAEAPPPTAYWDVRCLLKGKGVAFPDGALVCSVAEALMFADREGYPVVLKAASLLHKSDLGGVKLGLASPEALTAAFEDIRSRFPDSLIAVELQAPVADGVELLIGSRIDSHLGPLVTVAMGGIFAEIIAQSATALAPITHEAARELILSLKASPLLTGARGRPKLDIDSAAAVVVAISEVAEGLRDRIDSVELNPVLVLRDGAMALDARLIASVPHPDLLE